MTVKAVHDIPEFLRDQTPPPERETPTVRVKGYGTFHAFIDGRCKTLVMVQKGKKEIEVIELRDAQVKALKELLAKW